MGDQQRLERILARLEEAVDQPFAVAVLDLLMDRMNFALRLSRGVSFGIALVLGSFGIFCFYWSCMGAPFAADAIICLGSATAIVLACERADAR